MMIVKLVAPIKTVTVGNFRAEITEVNPKVGDCFKGTIESKTRGKVPVNWNAYGVCRDKPAGCALDMDAPEINDLLRIANHMQA